LFGTLNGDTTMWMQTTLLSLTILGAATGTAAACDCAEKPGAECKCEAPEKAEGCKCKAHKKGDAKHGHDAQHDGDAKQEGTSEHCHGDDDHGGEHEKAPQPK